MIVVDAAAWDPDHVIGQDRLVPEGHQVGLVSETIEVQDAVNVAD